MTWCLHSSLPPERVFHREHLNSGEAFAAWDRLLDTARHGPKYLAQPAIAEIVVNGIVRAMQTGLCEVDSFVVMPNHIHVLWTPSGSLAALIRAVKGSTSRDANRILGTTGQTFWQEEYFDRIVRTSDEAVRVRAYIEMNPVKAGLCAAPENYLWSSAHAAIGGRDLSRAGLQPRSTVFETSDKAGLKPRAD